MERKVNWWGDAKEVSVEAPSTTTTRTKRVGLQRHAMDVSVVLETKETTISDTGGIMFVKGSSVDVIYMLEATIKFIKESV